MSLARTSISMRADLMADAVERQKELRLASFSDYIQELIRRDLASQAASHLTIADQPHPAAPRPEKTVTYPPPQPGQGPTPRDKMRRKSRFTPSSARRKRKLPPEQRS